MVAAPSIAPMTRNRIDEMKHAQRIVPVSGQFDDGICNVVHGAAIEDPIQIRRAPHLYASLDQQRQNIARVGDAGSICAG